MNRRGFLGTITAIAGLALAKIKTPAAAIKLMYRGKVVGYAINDIKRDQYGWIQTAPSRYNYREGPLDPRTMNADFDAIEGKFNAGFK